MLASALTNQKSSASSDRTGRMADTWQPGAAKKSQMQDFSDSA
jgi:hypothetical protein